MGQIFLMKKRELVKSYVLNTIERIYFCDFPQCFFTNKDLILAYLTRNFTSVGNKSYTM